MSADDPDRLDVRSADGTELAVWVAGEGPPLVLVHGSMSDHAALDAVAAALGADATTFAMDRRGFGGSGDRAPYAAEREFEDVAAVVDAVAALAGRAVGLFGHSWGASCAMGGAAIAENVRRLVLYEPSLGLAYPPGAIEAVEAAVAAGDPESALIEVYTRILEIPAREIESLRHGLAWPARLATAPTIAREARAEEAWEYRPGRLDRVSAPTLLLAGSQSPAALARATIQAAGALRDARIEVLTGHGHRAHASDPEMLAARILDFTAS